MSSSNTIRDAITENRVFLNRVVFIFIFTIVLFLGLIVRLIILQVQDYEDYKDQSSHNQIKLSYTLPKRGVIYDRKGKILAQNLPTYNLEISPENIKDKNHPKEAHNLEETLIRLQKLFNISDEKIAKFHKKRKKYKHFQPIPFLSKLSEKEVAIFSENRPYFPGVSIKSSSERDYPYGLLTAHVVGYVGRINAKEFKKLPKNQYTGTTYIGKVGIEKFYEKQLHGTSGEIKYEANSSGRAVKTIAEIESKAGVNLTLTLDIELQQIAHDALEGYTGAIVAIEIKTGDVLVFASYPSFNPNLFVNGISTTDYRALQDSPEKPMFNRALRGRYPPGSTVKPFMGLAGLEYGVITAGKTKHCRGHYQLQGVKHIFRDWKRSGHGATNLNKAITQSCDVYFYDLAITLGIDKMHTFLSQFGFGKKTGIDLNGEKAGVYPSREWKKKKKKKRWYPGDSVITGIGQGFTLATPLQLAKATATLANRGRSITPHLVKSIENSGRTSPPKIKAEEPLALKEQNISAVINAMINVVHSSGGTAKSLARGINYKIAGKTGTAQVFSVKQNESYNQHRLKKKLHDHALFISFAPAYAPKIAIAVVVEHGGHGGSTAAPMAGKIIRSFLKGYKKSSTK